MEKLNQFQNQILDRFPDITERDILIFTELTDTKLQKLGLPKRHCDVNGVFSDCNPYMSGFLRRQYCLQNCGLKCLYSLEEKIKRIQWLYDLPKSCFVLAKHDDQYFTNEELKILYDRGLITDSRYKRLKMERELCE